MRKIFISVFMINFCLSAMFEENKNHPEWPRQFIGAGSFGKVYLSLYQPNLVVIKENNYNLIEKLEKVKEDKTTSLKKELDHISADICIGNEILGNAFMTQTLGVYLSDNGNVNYAMEPMLGGTFEKYLQYIEKNPTQLDLSYLKLSLARIAFAIEELHKKGWVWRDASSKNLFINFHNGLVKIGDFDLSRRVSDKRGYNKIEDDWNDFGSRIMAVVNFYLSKILDEDSKKEFSEIQKRLSGPSETIPGEITTLDQFKKLSGFKDVNWQQIENGTSISSFIPSKNQAYLAYAYQESPSELLKLFKTPESLPEDIEVKKIKELSLGKSFLDAINTALLESNQRIESAEDYCRMFLPK